MKPQLLLSKIRTPLPVRDVAELCLQVWHKRPKPINLLEEDLKKQKPRELNKGSRSLTLLEVIQRMVAKSSVRGDCVELPLAKSHRYPNVSVGGVIVKANRLAWTLFKSLPPAGMLVCHHCDNTRCINPDHLFLGTTLENNRDCNQKGRRNNAKGERVNTAKLTESQVLEIRDRLSKGDGIRALGREFGVSHRAIHFIKTGRNWKYL